MSASWIEAIAWAYVYLPISVCVVLCLAKITDVLVSLPRKPRRDEVDLQLEYFMGEAEQLMAERRRVQGELKTSASSGAPAFRR